MQDDRKDPRNARYHFKRSPNLLIVSNKGLNIIGAIYSNGKGKIVIKSAFRHSMRHLDSLGLQLLKLADSDDIYLQNSIKKWNRKFNMKDSNGFNVYKKINLDKPENWL